MRLITLKAAALALVVTLPDEWHTTVHFEPKALSH
jgi:hypothetical protein